MARNFSISSQPSQPGSGGYESDQSSDTTSEEHFTQIPNATVPLVWQRQDRLSQKLGNTLVQVSPVVHRSEDASQMDDDVRSRTSTLAADDREYDFPEKTPTATEHVRELSLDDEDTVSYQQDGQDQIGEDEPPAPHVPGPLEQQLAALMSKVVYLERDNPTIAVSPEEYTALQEKVSVLEAEKIQWNRRHEALFALRDEDVGNNILVRGLLAKERYDHESMKKLRDDDLDNVLVLRSKLADATRKLQRLEGSPQSSPAARGSSTPRERPRSIVMERRDTSNDLFQAARNAALEQRALELEKANDTLLKRVTEIRKTEVAHEKAWQRALELEKENRTLAQENTELKKDRVAGDKAWRAVVDGLQERLGEMRKTEVVGHKAWQRGLELEKEHQNLVKENTEMKRDRVVGDKAWRAVIGGLDEKLKMAPSLGTSPDTSTLPLKAMMEQSSAISHPASWGSSVFTASAPSSSLVPVQATVPPPTSALIPAATPVTTASPHMPNNHSSNALLLRQVEAVHEENASLRERMSQRVQKLRCEKEALQREVHAKEDEHADLERQVVRLQKKTDSGCPVCGN
ncbi:MAG: hypothetical protein Q9165_004210 [Trypethelium subeluteriae]